MNIVPIDKEGIVEIPSSIVRQIFSSTQEKKIIGLKELETFFREILEIKSESVIDAFIKSYKLKCYDKLDHQNTSEKRASLSGLIVMINLLNKTEKIKTSSLVNLVEMLINILKDSTNDSKLVIEITNNLDKLLKNHIELVLECFSEIFSVVIYLYSNCYTEINNSFVINLDDILKDVMSQAYNEGLLVSELNYFKIDNFYDVVENGLAVLNNTAKSIIVNWIQFIDLKTDKKIINEFDKLIPGIFPMLNESNKEILYSAEQLIANVQYELNKRFTQIDHKVSSKILNAIIIQSLKPGDRSKQIALEWMLNHLEKYLKLVQDNEYKVSELTEKICNENTKEDIVYNNSKNNCNKNNNNNYKSSIYSDKEKNITSSFKNNNNKLSFSFNNNNSKNKHIEIPYFLFGKIIQAILLNVKSDIEAISEKSLKCNEVLIELFDNYTNPEYILFTDFEEIIKEYFSSINNKNEELSLEIALIWIRKITKKYQNEIITKIDLYLDLTSINNDNVFNNIIDLLCEITTYNIKYEEEVMLKLFEKMSEMNPYIINKTQIIIKKLAKILTVKKFFLLISDVINKLKERELVKEKEFPSYIITSLDLFYLLSSDATELRDELKNIPSNTNIYFEKMFSAWCNNPISALILSILSKNFELSFKLILRL